MVHALSRDGGGQAIDWLVMGRIVNFYFVILYCFAGLRTGDTPFG